jgi:hypothetical protein
MRVALRRIARISHGILTILTLTIGSSILYALIESGRT